MTTRWFFSSAVLLATLSLGGCAVETSNNESASASDAASSDGELAAYAAVEAGKCTPDCSDRVCGLDPICGVSCGTCRTGESCDNAAGQCKAVCAPDCSGRECGLDPVCGVSCGTCGSGTSCDLDNGTCEAAPGQGGQSSGGSGGQGSGSNGGQAQGGSGGQGNGGNGGQAQGGKGGQGNGGKGNGGQSSGGKGGQGNGGQGHKCSGWRWFKRH